MLGRTNRCRASCAERCRFGVQVRMPIAAPVRRAHEATIASLVDCSQRPHSVTRTLSSRPTDSTSCLNHGLTALDVGIASPDAEAAAGRDCTIAMYAKKIDYYAPHKESLDSQNIEYQPMIWSAYGRPHPQTTAILRTLATRIARRRGCSDAEWRYRCLRASLVTEIWRRGAKMVRSCWPDLEDD